MTLLRHYIRSVSLPDSSLLETEKYPFNLAAVKFLDQINFASEVTFLVGENGTGKSTLLEAIAIAYGFNAEGGSKNFNFNTRETHSALHKKIRLSRGADKPKDAYFLRAESYYNVATNIDELDEDPENGGAPIKDFYGGKSLHEQSHGESFFALFNERLFGHGIYLLDEPEAALSPKRQMELLVRMHELIQKKSQFIIATHSPILLSYPGAKIIELNDTGYNEVSYEESEHYQLYHSFLGNHKNMIERLGII